MTMPTDSSIARAFWEMYTMQMDGFIDSDSLIVMAEQFDAESPAGCKVCGGGNVYCAACMSKSAPEVTTPPERVQIPAESKQDAPFSVCSQHRQPVPNCFACGTIVQCLKCPAHRPVGLYCGGPNCPLKPA